jgi:hypothetical protein
MQTMTGAIQGTTIELNGTPGLADGVEVEVVIRPVQLKRQPGEVFLRTEGALVDDDAWDAIMDELQESRLSAIVLRSSACS